MLHLYFLLYKQKKIKNLLDISEKSNLTLQEQQAQLEEANSQMQEQQLQLKQSSDELQRQNKELELSKIELNKKAEDLEQSIRNFISNSLKFTHKGYIKFIIEAFQNNIKISVQDTSIGIAKNKQKLIFQAFRQADGSTSRKYGGTGLGLSITKEFVSLLKGEIQIDSKENEGSTFSIVVPNIYTNNRKINKNSITISSLDTIN
ncbi:MAG: ATP-binding protein, partial [Campylobacterota bacterium]|nr:ATP-binding protein [Campylobacterota bacterium]